MVNKKATGCFLGIMVLSGAFGVLSAASVQGEEAANMPKPEAEAVWKYISEETPFTKWTFWEEGKGLNDNANNASHSPNHRVYLNKQTLAERETTLPLPNESILVSYINDPSGEPAAITVMYKVKGYNPEAGDWFWAKYGLNGEVQSAGKPAGCISCHAKTIPDNDYIASTPLKEKTSPAPTTTAPVPDTSPAPTTTAPVSDTSGAKKGGPLDPETMVAAHNQWRTKTGVPELKWSEELAASAKQWADQLAGSGCQMKHSLGKTGENIYWAGAATRSDGTSSMQAITEQNVVDAWGNEIEHYDYASNTCHGVCGHYTQVVWKSTTEVGCGMATCSDNAQIWVCQYSPRGNMVGEKPY